MFPIFAYDDMISEPFIQLLNFKIVKAKGT